ncbi:GNAT family N-acetyltransferase [Acinetobacter pittii]|uniref:GNAT family N-acetyltransferase n=1 Tax=Acinetobacter pittii TaxID=48296 RepID=UPI00301AE0AD
MRIRLATLHDIPKLVQIGAAFVSESPVFKNRGYLPEKAAKHFKWLLDGNGVIFLAIDKGQIVGGFAGGISTDWYSNHKLAYDHVMYVKPDKRSEGVAKALVQAFIGWAVGMGANNICCGTSTMVNTQNCIELYTSLGFQLSGAVLEMKV